MRQLFCFLLTLTTAATLSACADDVNWSTAKLHVHVTENGEIPQTYNLWIYHEDKLVKTDEFDFEYRRTSNFTELVNPDTGMYYFEARSGSLQVKDSAALYDFSKVQTIRLDLK